MDCQEQLDFIAARIKTLRRERRMTVQELAYRCDMERSNLSRIEAGRTNLTIRTLCTICNALGVSLCDVIGGERGCGQENRSEKEV